MTDSDKPPVEFVIKGERSSIVHDLFKKYPNGVVPGSLNHPAEAMQIEEQMSKFPAKPYDIDWIDEQLRRVRGARLDEVWIEYMTMVHGAEWVDNVRRLAFVDAVFEDWPADGWGESGGLGAELVDRKIRETQ